MIAVAEPIRAVAVGEHIRLMQALGRELERAMDAISRNDLLELEDSIASQQTLSSGLQVLANELRTPAGAGSVGLVPDGDVSRQIRQAVAELGKLNLRYSILLQHTSRSVAQMAALFDSVRGDFQEDAGAGLRHQTWSCQM